MATLVRDILYGAYGKSLKNQPNFIATEATELTQVVHRALRGLFAAAARINPYFFGEAALASYSGNGWARPSTAESVFYLETLGTPPIEIKVVPFDDRGAEPAFRTVYEFGQVFIPTLIGPGISFGNIRIYYAKRPAAITGLTDYLDAMWPESFNELLVLETAIYLALKDGRDSELATLMPERDRWAKLYFGFLEHETVGEVRRYGVHPRFVARGFAPAWSMLAGNAPGST